MVLPQSFNLHIESYAQTETTLLQVHNDLRTHVDSGKRPILCLLDLSVAFDTIDHDTFFQRLSARMGIHGEVLDWFKPYPMERCQSACVSSGIVTFRHLILSFPQISVNGLNGFSFYSDLVPQIAE